MKSAFCRNYGGKVAKQKNKTTQFQSVMVMRAKHDLTQQSEAMS